MKFEDYKRGWETEREAGGHSAKNMSRSHSVTASSLREELSFLRKITGDVRFDCAIKALEDNNLLNNEGKWVRGWKKSTEFDLHGALLRAIESGVNRGRSLRLACAHVAWDCSLENSSFDGAVAQLERIWRAAQSEGETPLKALDSM